MREHPVVNVKIADIKLDGKNPNKMDAEMEKRLLGSMEEFGNTQPIVIDKNTMTLADGEHRLLVYKNAGKTEIPAILIDFKSDAHRRVFRQAANKIRGSHDPMMDAQEYLALLEAGQKELLKMATGMSYAEVQKHLRRMDLLNKEEDFDIDESLKSIDVPIIKPGETWTLGEHRLLCGDSLVEENVALLLGGNKAQASFTDPPYNVNYDQDKSPQGKPEGSKGKIANDNLNPEEYKKFTETYCRQLLDNTEGGIYICMSCRELDILTSSFRLMGGHHSATIVWNKSSFVMGRRDYHSKYEPILYGWKEGNHRFWCGDRTQSDVWDVDKPNKNDLHPTMKPIELMTQALQNSTKEGDLVLDIFGGSGSTLIACEKIGRRCRIIEIDPRYCEVIIKRWEQFTGQKAVKEN